MGNGCPRRNGGRGTKEVSREPYVDESCQHCRCRIIVSTTNTTGTTELVENCPFSGSVPELKRSIVAELEQDGWGDRWDGEVHVGGPKKVATLRESGLDLVHECRGFQLSSDRTR